MKRKRPTSRTLTAALVLLLGVGGAAWLTSATSPASRADDAQPAEQPVAEQPDSEQPAPKAAAKTQPPDETPIGLRPYRVLVTVACDGSSALPPQYRDKLLDELRSAISRRYGRMWNADVELNGWLAPATRLGLERLTSADLVKRFPESQRGTIAGYEKVFVLTIDASGPQIRTAGREFDLRSQQLGPLESAATYRRRAVADAAFSLLPRMFQPSLSMRTQSGSSDEVELLLQAGDLLPGDPTLQQVAPDDAIVCRFRYLDKEGTVQRIQEVPWTYVLVDGIERSYIAGTVVSAFGRAPLGTGRRRRVDLYASRVRPNRPSSRLRMVYQTDEDRPLIGYNIRLVRKRGYRDEPDAPPGVQFSGRDGFVHIPVDPDRRLVWVYVFSGEALLARVPYVPGVSTEETIPLPDDSIRLDAERDLELLKSRLIDTVARRATLMTLARMAADDEKLDADQKRAKVNEKFQEIDAMDGLEQFEAELGVVRTTGVNAARRLNNRFAERRIAQMCDKTALLIRKHLDPAPIYKLRSELIEGLR